MPSRRGGASRNQELRVKLDPIVKSRLDSIPYATKLKLLDNNQVKFNLKLHADSARKKIEQRCTNKLTEFEKSMINESFLRLFPDAIVNANNHLISS